MKFFSIRDLGYTTLFGSAYAQQNLSPAGLNSAHNKSPTILSFKN